MMIPVSLLPNAKKLLIQHEGYKTSIYTDSLGKVSSGVGYNLSDRGLPPWFIDKQFEDDLSYFHDKLSENFKWYDKLNDARKIALIDMCFMGFAKFCKFKMMLNALEIGKYNVAADEVLDSLWAEQVGPNRANCIANIIRSGSLDMESITC